MRTTRCIVPCMLVLCGALSADDKLVERAPAFVLKDGDVRLEGVQMSPNGKLIAARGRDDQVRVWSLPSGKLLYRLDQRPRYMDGPALTFTADGKALLVWSARRGPDLSRDVDERLCWYDVKTGKEGRTLFGSDVFGGLVVHAPDGKMMTTGGTDEHDEALYLREPQTGRELFKIEPPQLWRAVAITPDGRRLFVANRADEIWFWDLRTKERTQWRKQDPNVIGIRTLLFAPDGKRLAVGHGGRVMVLDLATGKRVCQTDLLADDRAVALIRGGRRVLQASGPYISVFDADTGARLYYCGPYGSNIKDLVVSSGEKWLAVTTSAGDGVRVFKVSEW